jgi:hypothetical protein
VHKIYIFYNNFITELKVIFKNIFARILVVAASGDVSIVTASDNFMSIVILIFKMMTVIS